MNTYQQHISAIYHQQIITTRNKKNTRCIYNFIFIMDFNPWGLSATTEYSITLQEHHLYNARLILHRRHQLRWGNNPQQISICTINKCINHAPTCAKQLVINPYHKQVYPTTYQVYTNHVSTTHQQWLINMYQHHQLYTSCMCQHINCLSQPWLVLD